MLRQIFSYKKLYSIAICLNGTVCFKNENHCLNTKIYSYLETSGGQSSNLHLNVFLLVMRVPGQGPEHRESE